jgi:hypothetical protein
MIKVYRNNTICMAIFKIDPLNYLNGHLGQMINLWISCENIKKSFYGMKNIRGYISALVQRYNVQLFTNISKSRVFAKWINDWFD